MSYLSKDQLDSYLKNLGNKAQTSPTATGASPESLTGSSKPEGSKATLSQARNDLVYPMDGLSLSDKRGSAAQDAFEASLRAPKQGTAGASANAKRTPPLPARKPVQFASSASSASPAPATPPRPANAAALGTPKSPTPPRASPSGRSPPATPSRTPSIDPGKKVSVANPLYSATTCPGCKKSLSTGPSVMVAALGKKWHKGCFTCHTCRTPLDSVEFFEKDGNAYCGNDYRQLFNARCDYCKEPIRETSIQALGKQYHVGHFFCHTCRTPFDQQSGFMVQDGHAYCENDYLALFGHKCQGCGQFIKGAFVNALDGDWHKDCFVCTQCRQPFPHGTFHVYNNKPYCAQHAKPTTTTTRAPVASPAAAAPAPAASAPAPAPTQGSPANNVCHTCKESLDGAKMVASAFGRQYHAQHFECILCHTRLSSRVPGLWTNNGRDEVICLQCAK
ncbi:hypothetical protein BC940DRAFT_295670 [Gongronella butleri]|nr:hypothetical protein BC940DRAFT_295670 [Gongronella butleri]